MFPTLPTRRLREDLGWLALIVGIALAMRLYALWDVVFMSTHVNLTETDAWYHLRATEHLVRNFPHHLQFDPYTDGRVVPLPPLLDYVAAVVALIVGAGHPSSSTIATVAALMPPVLGVLTVVAVYAVARVAAGSVAGLLAAVLAATLPGHFLDRTLLGFGDHHALEALVSTLVLWAVARALTRSGATVSAGLWLAAALTAFRLTWTSSAMLVAVLAAWLIAHAALQSWRRGGAGEVGKIVGIAVMIALPLALMFESLEPYQVHLHVAALAVLGLVAAGIEVGHAGLARRWWTSRQLAALASAAAVFVIVVARLAFPEIVSNALGELSRFSFTNPAQSVIEAKPLLMMNGDLSWQPVWAFFRSGFVLGLVAVAWLAVRWMRQGRASDLLLIVWTLAMYLATFGVNRFGYYLVPAVSIVGGALCASAIDAGRRAGARWRVLAVVAVSAGAFGLNLVPTLASTERNLGTPAGWYPAYEWLRRQTDEPFGDPDYYDARYDVKAPVPSRWSVMVWWDYGYELLALSRRVPVSIPTGGGAVEAAKFFTAPEADALAVLDETRSRYVLLDELMPIRSVDGTALGKFAPMPSIAGQPTSRYYDAFVQRDAGGERTILLFFEGYYRSMAFHLGVAGGGAMAAADTAVVTWVIENRPGTGATRVVTSIERFPTYDAAVARLAQLGPGNHAIAGTDPSVSPVPLAPLQHLRRVFATPAPGAFQQGAVQIFERVR